MSREQVSIKTKDGDCRAWVLRPEGQGPWPAAIIYMDAPAIRPALFDFGERLAGHGYFTLLPDLFYRDGPYEPMDISTLFSDEAARAALFAKMGRCVSAEAGVQGEVEIYDGAMHGYTMPDMKVYNEAAAERHWRDVFSLFDSTLK